MLAGPEGAHFCLRPDRTLVTADAPLGCALARDWTRECGDPRCLIHVWC
jgi:hypothetical protein